MTQASRLPRNGSRLGPLRAANRHRGFLWAAIFWRDKPKSICVASSGKAVVDFSPIRGCIHTDADSTPPSFELLIR